jgi:hypothetical protein
MAKRSDASRDSARHRERMQLVMVIGRLVLEALKALHSGRF